jgi:capsular exopolysaccharide synthesis family protein
MSMILQSKRAVIADYPPRLEEPAAFDIWRLIEILRRRWMVIVAAVIIGILLGVAYSFIRTPKYTAMATVMLNQRTEAVVKDAPDVLSSLPRDDTVADTQVEYLREPSIAKLVVQRLGLERDPRVASEQRGLLGRIAAAVGLSETSQDESPFDWAVSNLTDDVDVERRGETQVIDISFKAVDPMLATQIANGYADAYLEAQITDKVNATNAANKWLTQRTAALRTEVTAAEQAVAQYQAQHGLLVATGSELNEQRVAQLQAAETVARADLAEKQSRLQAAKRQLAAGKSGEELGEALNSPVVQNLRSQLALVRQKGADLEERYGPKHPDVVNNRAQTELLEGQIQAELHRIIGGLQSDALAAQSRLGSLQGSVGGAQGALAQGKSAQVGLDELTRNADAKKSLYESYLARQQQTSTQAGLAAPDAAIISRATPPDKPSQPKFLLDVVLGAMAGLCLGGAAAGLLELLSTGLRSHEAVEQELGEPCAAAVPLLEKGEGAPIEAVLQKPLSMFAESFRQLRVFVENSVDRQGRVLAIASALPREGKTTTAICFARLLSQSGARVLLVDCDLRVRSLTKMLGFQGSQGVAEALSGQVDPISLVQDDRRSPCKVLPGSEAEMTSLLDFEPMQKLLDRLRPEFDYILLDCPPALAVADAGALARNVDGVLFLVRWQSTPRKAAKLALDALQTANANVVGAVLTQVDVAAQPLHGGSLSYYRKFSEYYAS